ncbi:hypothetical protein [Lactobacillus terrae]|uniref:hypothetical protein n=1 Tax=Lactobacillus terrae TaxID=2269374 RepID=UPI000C1B7734|nr:hypothetical protein [Lactobacillus terrae]
MKSKETNKRMHFLEVLTLIFVIAKITGFITWSWWLVFLPVFIPLIIALVALGIGWLVIAIRVY